MKSKILIFTTAYYPLIGGAEIAIQETVRRLKDRFDFYIITHRISRSLPGLETVDGVPVYRLGFGTKIDRLFLFPFLAAWQGYKLSNQLLVTSNSVLLWGIMITYASIGAFFVKLFRPQIPFVLTIQEGDSEAHMTWGKFGLAGLWWRLLLKKADYVTAISSYLKDYTRRRGYRGATEVVPNGVDISKFKNQNSKIKITNQNSKIIITTSRLVYKNGIDTLILAMAEVRKTVPDVECWVIGDGPEKESLKLKVKSLKLDDHVKFFGGIPHEKISEYLHQADVFIRPSRSEGMGNSFVEALAAGLPIIGTPVGGITDIIEDPSTGSGQATGLFVKTDDPEDCAAKIVQLLNDSSLARRIADQGKRMVEEKFSWDGIASAYARIFIQNVQHSVLHILMATPLYPPYIGGPSLYAKNLGEQFVKAGHNVTTLVFTNYLKFPSGIRHMIYVLALFRHAFRSDIIFALDQFTAGAAVLVSLVLRKPVVVRVEGDFLWEEFVERTRQDITLAQFYKEPQPLSFKERLVRGLSGWALRRATLLVFSSEWRRRMVVESSAVPYEKTAIIQNVFPSLQIENWKLKIGNSRVILYAGRMLYLKNLYRLIQAFASVNPVRDAERYILEGSTEPAERGGNKKNAAFQISNGVNNGTYELHLVGDGPEKERLKFKVKSLKLDGAIRFFNPLPRAELLEKMRTAAFFVLPSLSDVGPNVIADAVSTQTPFIMSAESGYGEYVGGAGLFIDPLDEGDLASKIKMLMREAVRTEYKNRLKSFALKREWNTAADEWVLLFRSACS